jgi:hypothetical protein
MLASGSEASTAGATVLGEERGLLDGWRERFISYRRAGLISLPGQVGGFPAEYAIGCQPSTTTTLHVLLREDIHLQARSDNSHSQGA